MKTASIRDLHLRTSELVREAADGTVILIAHRGKRVAELRPLSTSTRGRRLPELTEIWERFPFVYSDSGHFLEEGR